MKYSVSIKLPFICVMVGLSEMNTRVDVKRLTGSISLARLFS